MTGSPRSSDGFPLPMKRPSEEKDRAGVDKPENADPEIPIAPVPPRGFVHADVIEKRDPAPSSQPEKKVVILSCCNPCIISSGRLKEFFPNDMAFPPPHAHAKGIEKSEVQVIEPVGVPIGETFLLGVNEDIACCRGNAGPVYGIVRTPEEMFGVGQEGIRIEKNDDGSPGRGRSEIPTDGYTLGGRIRNDNLIRVSPGDRDGPVSAAAVAHNDLNAVVFPEPGSELPERALDEFLFLEGGDDHAEHGSRVHMLRHGDERSRKQKTDRYCSDFICGKKMTSRIDS